MADQIDRSDFYNLTPPTAWHQGDIVVDVPLLSFPAASEIYVIRTGNRDKLDSLAPGEVSLFREPALSNRFDGPEHVVASAERGAIAILTPTCDLDESLWVVCPVLEFEEEDPVKDDVMRFKKKYRFPLAAHPNGYYGDSFIDFGDIRSIPAPIVKKGTRIAVLSVTYQAELASQAGKLFGRFWGFAAGEEVPENGLYRCYRDCLFYELKAGEQQPLSLKKGDRFPDCPNCIKINKAAQFVLLRRHKKF